ncbi:hypothetical protein TAMC210_24210 [Thermanaeromonas sp. C210]|nr:hypothetical protein TAMC210_24210 [Thermanaeromonas sp. C210]
METVLVALGVGLLEEAREDLQGQAGTAIVQ